MPLLGAISVTVAVVAPAVPVTVTSPVAKPVTGSPKTTVKLIVLPLVGSAWPTAWLMVTSGGVVSYRTLLSVLVEAALPLVAASCAAPAGMLAMIVPSPVMPLTLIGVGGRPAGDGAGERARRGAGAQIDIAGGKAGHRLAEDHIKNDRAAAGWVGL